MKSIITAELINTVEITSNYMVGEIKTHRNFGAINIYISDSSSVECEEDYTLKNGAIKEGVLRISDYRGQIGIPRNTSLYLYSTWQDLKGEIASPAHIHCTAGNIDLIIDREAKLKLSAKTDGALSVDGEDIRNSGKKGCNYYRKDFYKEKKLLKQSIANSISEGKTKVKSPVTSVEYDLLQLRPDDTTSFCAIFGLIYVQSATGNITLLRKGLGEAKGTFLESIVRSSKINNYPNTWRLRDELSIAVKREDYALAAKLRDEIARLETAT